jgi:hypothetical protein
MRKGVKCIGKEKERNFLAGGEKTFLFWRGEGVSVFRIRILLIFK